MNQSGSEPVLCSSFSRQKHLERTHQGTQGQGHRPRDHLVHPGHRQWVQHHHQAVQVVLDGMLVYPLQGGAGHAEQEAGDLLKLPAQSKADLESEGSRGRLRLSLL